MKLFFNHPVFEAQSLRMLGHTFYGGADLGECFATIQRIPDGDTEGWYREWYQLGEHSAAIAGQCLAAGHPVSAREAFLRSSNYYRGAYTFLLQAPLVSQLLDAFDRQTETFHQACSLFSPAGESVEISYEGTTLPGIFFKVEKEEQARPTIILNGGYDSTLQEMYFYSAAAALERGYNVLCFDGPGQGRVLFKQHLPFRPDWEKVIEPVMDYVLSRSDVDASHVALLGCSWGGYLAPRAASAEHRLAACIADPGQYDQLEAIRSRIPLPRPMQERFPDLEPALFQQIINAMMSKPEIVWVIERGMLTHGVATPLDYIRSCADYTLVDRAQLITCPTLICQAEDDPIGAFAGVLYDALTCPKQWCQFTSAEGAGEHCECGARSLFNQRVFDWLDEVFKG